MTLGKSTLLTFTLSLSFLSAQTISVETREVAVDVTVTDSKGATIGDLKKEDFTLTDEGKPRPFEFSITTRYEPITGKPGPLRAAVRGPSDTGPAPEIGHSTAIILDNVNAFTDDAGVMHVQANSLIAKAPQGERIALYAIVRKQGLILLQDYADDRDLLRKSLSRNSSGGMRPAPGGRFFSDQPIPPYLMAPANDADMAAMWQENSEEARLSLQALAGQLTLIPGRKSLFWVTTGFNPWVLGLGTPPSPHSAVYSLSMLKPSWEKTLSALNQANVAVNVVDARGLYGASNPNTGTIVGMREIAEQTGGKAYYGRNDLDDAMVEGITASRATYTLRFQLSEQERDKTFHRLKVEVNRKGLQLFYRQGYYAGGMQMPSDLVAGKVEGKALEARASASASPLDAFVQLPWFYTGTNRASVHLTVALKAAPREPVEIVGIALRPDGSEASRFADRIPVDSGGRYEHPFTLAAGSYTFRLTAGSGATVMGTKEVPLLIEPWSSGSFGIGGIVLTTEAHAALPGPPRTGALIAAGKEFSPAANPAFAKSDRVYLFTEIYDAASAASLTMQFRVLDAKTGEMKMDSGVGAAASFVQPGNPVVPFATILPVGQLAAGSYRLELRAGHSQAADGVLREVDFEVK